MATITSGSRTGGGKTFTVGDTVYFTNYSTTLTGGAGSNSGYTMPWHGKITKLYDTSYTNWIYTQSNADASGKTSSYAMLIRPGWATKGYKITVTYNHNSGSGTGSQTGYVGASLTGTSSRTGYNFAGWYTAASGGSRVTTIPASATTYYAHWTAKTFTVTLNANGGSGGTGSVTATYAANMPSATMPTRSGYKFAGYYDTSAATGGTQYYTATGASARTYNKTAAATLYARWTASSATITFDGNGETGGDTPEQTVGQTVETPLQLNGFTKTGYHFIGWAESSDGEIVYKDQDSIIIPSGTTSKILYAKWQINTYYINYIGNNATYGIMSQQICQYNSPGVLFPIGYQKKNKTFKHWAELESFTKRISYEYSEDIVIMSYQLQDDEIFISASAGISEDGQNNPEGFEIIRGPFYNKNSKIVTVTGQGVSTAIEKEFYLDITLVDSSYTASIEIEVETIPNENVILNIESQGQIIVDRNITPEEFTSNIIQIDINYPSEYTNITVPTPDWANNITLLSSGASYNIYQDKNNFLNLTEQTNGIINLYAIWQNGQSRHRRLFNDIILYLGKHTYPVGSVFITEINQNPSIIFGGEWELIRKEFIPKTVTDAITFNTTNTTNGYSVIEIYPGSINIRASWMPKVAYADSTLEVGTFDLSKIGLTHYHLVSEVGVGDALNSAFLLYFQNSKIRAVQVVPATNATSVAASSSYYIYVNSFMMFRNPYDMLDNFCDKFYWKRIR